MKTAFFPDRSYWAPCLLLFLLFILLKPQAVFAAEKPLVFVSVSPQKYLLERLAGSMIDIEVLVQPGHNPHSYDPSARQMARLARADMLMTTGVPFEQVWLPRIRRLNPQMQMVNTLEEIQETAKAYPDRHNSHHDESHDADHDHDLKPEHEEDHHDSHHGHEHQGDDPHVWMDPIKALAQAEVMMHALQKRLPEASDQLAKNFAALADDLSQLDHEVHEQLAAFEGRTFMVFHPAWGHFAARYHLEQIAIEYQGKSPSARQLVQLSEQARSENIRIILVQEQFNRKPAERIADNIGARVVNADPLPEDLPAAIRELSHHLLESWN